MFKKIPTNKYNRECHLNYLSSSFIVLRRVLQPRRRSGMSLDIV